MTRARKRSVLSNVNKREILAIVAVGCGRRTAAEYVGCTPATIVRAMEQDETFAAEIRRHELNPEIGFMRNIQDAAQNAQYWRAAAWWLERRRPEDFGTKKAGLITAAQLQSLLSALTEMLTEEVPDPKIRKKVIRRVDGIISELFCGAVSQLLASMKENASDKNEQCKEDPEHGRQRHE